MLFFFFKQRIADDVVHVTEICGRHKTEKVSIYLFNDLLCFTKNEEDTFHVLNVIKWFSNLSQTHCVIEKVENTNKISITNPRKPNENHFVEFSESYLRNSWFVDIQNTLKSYIENQKENK